MPRNPNQPLYVAVGVSLLAGLMVGVGVTIIAMEKTEPTAVQYVPDTPGERIQQIAKDEKEMIDRHKKMVNDWTHGKGSKEAQEAQERSKKKRDEWLRERALEQGVKLD